MVGILHGVRQLPIYKAGINAQFHPTSFFIFGHSFCPAASLMAIFVARVGSAPASTKDLMEAAMARMVGLTTGWVSTNAKSPVCATTAGRFSRMTTKAFSLPLLPSN